MSTGRGASAGGAWHAPTLPPFRPAEGEDLQAAVSRDIDQVLLHDGEFPSPARYAALVDPMRSPRAAEAVAVAAFESAPRFMHALADAWRRRFASWQPAIDRAIGVAMFVEADDGDASEDWRGARLGASVQDGRGRYELVAPIGRGSSGTVYRAVDRALSDCGAVAEVAVKVIPCARAEIEARLREAGAARSIADAGIARVLDAGTVELGQLDATQRAALGLDEAGIVIVTELIDGMPLYLWKAMRPDRSPDDCVSVALRVQAALRACHAGGVAHGDLSPANILVDASGAPRVVDFGHASWSAAASADDGGDAATDLPSQIVRDQRRLGAVLAWLMRDLEPTRARSRALDAAEAIAKGLTPTHAARGNRRALSVAAVALLAAGVWSAWTFVGPGATARGVGAGRPTPTTSIDPIDVVFGTALDDTPEVEAAVRELLVAGTDGPMFKTQGLVLAASAQDAVAALARKPVLDERDRAHLLAAAILTLATPDSWMATPFAVLAAERSASDALAVKDPASQARDARQLALAQTVADITYTQFGKAPAIEASRLAVQRCVSDCSAPGLIALLEQTANKRPKGSMPGAGARPRSG
jgi:hypothetical protein